MRKLVVDFSTVIVVYALAALGTRIGEDEDTLLHPVTTAVQSVIQGSAADEDASHADATHTAQWPSTGAVPSVRRQAKVDTRQQWIEDSATANETSALANFTVVHNLSGASITTHGPRDPSEEIDYRRRDNYGLYFGMGNTRLGTANNELWGEDADNGNETMPLRPLQPEANEALNRALAPIKTVDQSGRFPGDDDEKIKLDKLLAKIELKTVDQLKPRQHLSCKRVTVQGVVIPDNTTDEERYVQNFCADGFEQNQELIQKGILDCAESARGADGNMYVQVLELKLEASQVHNGSYTRVCVKGPLKLKSHVVMHIPSNVWLKFVGEPEDYAQSIPEAYPEEEYNALDTSTGKKKHTCAKGHDGKQGCLALTFYEAAPIRGYHPPIQAVGATGTGIIGAGVIDGGYYQPGFETNASWPLLGELAKTLRKDKILEVFDDRALLHNMSRDGTPVMERVFGAHSKDIAGNKMNIGVLRPNFIEFLGCRSVVLQGVTITGSPMWAVHPVLTDGFLARGVTVLTSGLNNDGIVPDMSQYVLIENSAVRASDDSISIKAGRNDDARRMTTGLAKKTFGVVVRETTVGSFDLSVPPSNPKDITFPRRNGFTIGSEGSGGIEEIWFVNNKIKSRNTGILMASSWERGGKWRGIHVHGLTMKNVVGDGIKILMDFEGQSGGSDTNHQPAKPEISDIIINAVTAVGTQTGLVVNGLGANDKVESIVSNLIVRDTSFDIAAFSVGPQCMDDCLADNRKDAFEEKVCQLKCREEGQVPIPHGVLNYVSGDVQVIYKYNGSGATMFSSNGTSVLANTEFCADTPLKSDAPQSEICTNMTAQFLFQECPPAPSDLWMGVDKNAIIKWAPQEIEPLSAYSDGDRECIRRKVYEVTSNCALNHPAADGSSLDTTKPYAVPNATTSKTSAAASGGASAFTAVPGSTSLQKPGTPAAVNQAAAGDVKTLAKAGTAANQTTLPSNQATADQKLETPVSKPVTSAATQPAPAPASSKPLTRIQVLTAAMSSAAAAPEAAAPEPPALPHKPEAPQFAEASEAVNSPADSTPSAGATVDASVDSPAGPAEDSATGAASDAPTASDNSDPMHASDASSEGGRPAAFGTRGANASDSSRTSSATSSAGATVAKQPAVLAPLAPPA